MPDDLKAIKIIPSNRTVLLDKMPRFSSAPDMTKKRILRGEDQRSALSMSSSEASQMLQKTAPSIMQVKRSENDMVTGPSLKLVEAMPTVKRTKATATESLFEREWK